MAKKKEAKQRTVNGEKQQPTQDEVRSRAYQIYCTRNGGPGNELDDWTEGRDRAFASTHDGLVSRPNAESFAL